MQCLFENCDREGDFARGYCQRHYWRLRQSGEMKRQNVVNHGVCSEPGCKRGTFAKNLCSMHYQRNQPALYNTWRNMRSKYKEQFAPEWASFEQFFKDVGERPSPRHQLRRVNPSLPWSAENIFWLEAVADTKTVSVAEYSRRWSMRAKYNLTPEEMNEILKSQDHKCPGCGRHFSEIDPSTGQPLKMCIDHNHETGDVRGILCDPCNKVLGLASDSVVTLRNLASYLESHPAKKGS